MPTTFTAPKKKKKSSTPTSRPAKVKTKVAAAAVPEGTYQLRARVPADRYRRAEAILAQLGLTPAVAVNMLLAQIEEKNGIPFEVTLEDDERLFTDEETLARWTEQMGPYGET